MSSAKEIVPKIIVRVRNSYYATERGLACRREISYLKKQCEGFNYLADDVAMIGADEVMSRITNFDTVEDGIYEVVMTNMQTDWETGCLDNWDYKLIPRAL